jgi:uncharacterized membrane protein YebE (DUF533 family)
MFVSTEGKVTLEFGLVDEKGEANDIEKKLEITFDDISAKIYIDGELQGSIDVEHMVTFAHVLQISLLALPSDDGNDN